jgi:hypothetical protein
MWRYDGDVAPQDLTKACRTEAGHRMPQPGKTQGGHAAEFALDPKVGQKLTKKQRIAQKKKERRTAKERRGSDDEDLEADLQDSRFAVRPSTCSHCCMTLRAYTKLEVPTSLFSRHSAHSKVDTFDSAESSDFL